MVALKMLKTNCGEMPTANIRSVTGTMTNFSLRMRSEKPLQLSARGPLKSDCIARMKVTAVKRRPSKARAGEKVTGAKEALQIKNYTIDPFNSCHPDNEKLPTHLH